MAAIDEFDKTTPGLTTSFTHCANVTPDDNNDLTYVSRGIYIGTAGNVNMTLADGTTKVVALGVGWHPIRATRILATNTTALGIVYGA